ncbi:MAG: hypothetical protein WC553_03640 [Patescibacteria group bacterium]
MNNHDFNQLPILPDPLENQATPLPISTEPQVVNQRSLLATRDSSLATLHPRRNYLRAGLIFGGAIAILTLVLFGSRLIDLLNLRGTKAGQSVILNSDNFVDGNWFEKDSDGNLHEGDSRVLFEVVDGKLVLNNPGQ